MKEIKALSKVISPGLFPGTLRVILTYLGLNERREENIKIKYIPESLRLPNSLFMMIWDKKTRNLLRIEKLTKKELQVIYKIINVSEQTDKIDQYSPLVEHFFSNIIGADYYNCSISNESCLEDFAIAFGDSLKDYQTKIQLHYDVDITNIIYSPIVNILEKIQQKNSISKQ